MALGGQPDTVLGRFDVDVVLVHAGQSGLEGVLLIGLIDIHLRLLALGSHAGQVLRLRTPHLRQAEPEKAIEQRIHTAVHIRHV
jgi:hypothetical protein